MSLPIGYELRNVEKGSSSIHFFDIRNPVTNKRADPDTLSLFVTPPGGASTEYVWTGVDGAVWTKHSTGSYRAEVLHDAVGTWKIKMTAANPTVVKVATVVVRDSYA